MGASPRVTTVKGDSKRKSCELLIANCEQQTYLHMTKLSLSFC